MVTVQVTSTLPVWIVLSFFSLVTGEMVWTVYCRVHPLAVRTSFSRSVYARGLAYGVTRPLRPSRDVAATSHLTSSLSNASSSRSHTSPFFFQFFSIFLLLVRSSQRSTRTALL